MGKGTNGRGTIYQDKHGTWWAQLPPDEYGKRPKASAATEQEAVRKLRELEQKRAKRLNVKEGRQNLEQLLNTWLDEYVQPTLKAKTTAGHRYICKQYIIPYLGKIRLDQLNAMHLQRWLNTLRNKKLSETTLKNAFTRLKAALNVALKAGLVAENVAMKVDAPRAEAHEIEPLNAEEVTKLLTTAEGHRHEALMHVAVRLGLRRGELVGLRWAEVDLARGELRVTGQLQRVDGETIRTTGKGRRGRISSHRRIPLDSDLVAVLRKHWDQQQEERKLLGAEWKEHGLVFASQRGTPLDVRSLARQIDALLEAAGLPHKRIHDLRHTAATLMLAAGVQITDVSKILGHASPEVTARIYAHSLEENRRKAIEAVAQLLKRGVS